MSKELESSTKLLRHFLNSIDLSDIDELKTIVLTPPEAMDRAGDVELFYKNHFEKVLKLFIQRQLEFIGIGIKDERTGEKIAVETEGQLLFARGTINGLLLIKEWMEEQRKLSLSRFEEKSEELSPEKPLPEL